MHSYLLLEMWSDRSVIAAPRGVFATRDAAIDAGEEHDEEWEWWTVLPFASEDDARLYAALLTDQRGE